MSDLQLRIEYFLLYTTMLFIVCEELSLPREILIPDLKEAVQILKI